MKKLLGVLLLGVLLVGCSEDKKDKTLKIGVSPIPHGEILNFVKNDLLENGINVEIIEFTDYVTPNIALASKEIDVNFFQHLPYLKTFSEEKKLDLVGLDGIFVAPIALYSKKIKNIEALSINATIAIPNDPTNGGRALILLHNSKLITLKDEKNLLATEKDIISNPKNIKIKSLDAAQLPRILVDVDAAIINDNYAFEAGLSSEKDALLVEGEESPYSNILAVRKGDEKNEDILKLIKVLKSEKVRNFIIEKYKGSIVPIF
ncbi:MAG: MetQ/NlpA family ABC transporter substrate-binding protein [Fusobacteriaceae bacterium]